MKKIIYIATIDKNSKNEEFLLNLLTKYNNKNTTLITNEPIFVSKIKKLKIKHLTLEKDVFQIIKNNRDYNQKANQLLVIDDLNLFSQYIHFFYKCQKNSYWQQTLDPKRQFKNSYIASFQRELYEENIFDNYFTKNNEFKSNLENEYAVKIKKINYEKNDIFNTEINHEIKNYYLTFKRLVITKLTPIVPRIDNIEIIQKQQINIDKINNHNNAILINSNMIIDYPKLDKCQKVLIITDKTQNIKKIMTSHDQYNYIILSNFKMIEIFKNAPNELLAKIVIVDKFYKDLK